MGRMYANGLAGEVTEGRCSLREALIVHLHSNHFPPVHLSFLTVAEQAITGANEEEWDKQIELPNGLTRSVGQIVEGLHLGDFLDA